jgi:hypothetical protein
VRAGGAGAASISGPSARGTEPATLTGHGAATGAVVPAGTRVPGQSAPAAAPAAVTPAASSECWTTEPAGATDPRGNLTETCSSDVDGTITVAVQTATFDDPRTSANWRSNSTGIVWAFSQSGTGDPQYVAELGTPSIGGPVVNVLDANDKLLCQATPSFDVGNRLYMASFPASCIGTPPQYWWQTFMGYDYGSGVSDVGYVYAGPLVASGTAPPPARGPRGAGAPPPPPAAARTRHRVQRVRQHRLLHGGHAGVGVVGTGTDRHLHPGH